MSTIPHKPCHDCDESKPLDQYTRDTRARDGRHYRCRACLKIFQAKVYQRNKEKIKESVRVYAAAHPEQTRRYGRNAYHRQRDKYKARYYARTEEQKALDRKYATEYKHRRIAANPAWSEKQRELARERYRRNPVVNLAKSHARRVRIAENGGSFTPAEWAALCEKYDHRCLCCGEQRRLTIDHVVPIAKGGRNDISNIQPLCMECNARKFNTIIDYRT